MSMQEFSDNLSTLSYVSRHRVPVWLYDSKKKTILGRTCLNWGKCLGILYNFLVLCLLFYLVYYACLASFFVGMLWILLQIQVPETEPARTGMQSILNFKPGELILSGNVYQIGLGFRPLVDVQKSLIKFAASDPQQYLVYTQNLDAFLDLYTSINSKPDGKFAQCEGGQGATKDIDKVCKFPLEQLGPCYKDKKYGYADGKPCVILKINKIFGWLPDIADPSVSNNPLVNCSGQNPADDENMGKVAYYPSKDVKGKSYGEFSSDYFPFIGQSGYLGPLVAIQFESPKKHVAILVKCQLSNLNNTYNHELGFELLID